MKINENEITLKPLMDEDVNIFKNWLSKNYIYKWFCNDGGEEEKKAWLNEIENRNGDYNYMKHFIVKYNEKKIGFCLYMDCHYEQDYSQEIYGRTFCKNYAYEIGFCIGEEEYLNKGIGKIIVKKLEEKIIEIGGKEILADPNEENIVSIKTLLSNGFEKIKDNVYKKLL